jgi:hypothetical protein
MLTSIIGQSLNPFPIYETLLLITWFCLWEAINSSLFERNKMRLHRLNLLRLYNASIQLVRDKEPIMDNTTIITNKTTIITDRSTIYSDKSPKIQNKFEPLTKIHTQNQIGYSPKTSEAENKPAEKKSVETK